MGKVQLSNVVNIQLPSISASIAKVKEKQMENIIHSTTNVIPMCYTEIECCHSIMTEKSGK